MINPSNITNYNLTQNELEKYLIFWIFAAGHNATYTSKGIERFISNLDIKYQQLFFLPLSKQTVVSPFYLMRCISEKTSWDYITDILSMSGLGCWRLKSQTLCQLTNKIKNGMDIQTCSPEELEKIKGIGPKTSRAFILHSRENVRLAVLDVHILKFLRTKGIKTPTMTPTGKKYRELEREFLKLCDEQGKTAAEYDLEIWKSYAVNLENLNN